MNVKQFIFSLIFSISGFCALAQLKDTVQTNADIRQLVKNYETAWNAHDPKALAANYRLDATWVNWFGAMYTGREDIENHYRTTHETYFKASRYYTRAVEDIQYLTPDIAVVHVRTGLTDDSRYPGQTFEFRRMIVLTRVKGIWLIQSGQNAKLEKGIK
jgi:uncharacterized protein (TIGR02246 family)